MRVEDDFSAIEDVSAETDGTGAPSHLPVAELLPPPGKPVMRALVPASGTELVVPESDPERIAFQLWNSGQVDEAVLFLEREIAAERSRTPSRRILSHARRKVLGDAAETIAPQSQPQVSERRKRRLETFASADFTATGAPAGKRMLDLLAVPADQIVPPPPPRRIWPLGVALCLVVALGFAAASYLYGPDRALSELALPVSGGVDAPAQTASLPAHAKPVAPAAETASAATADLEIVEVPPPEDDMVVDDASPPADDAVEDSLPPEDTVADDADAAAAAREESPQTVAALGNPDADGAAVDDNGGVPVAVRLPRHRPEPPPSVLQHAAPAVAASEEEEITVPMVLGSPPSTLQPPRQVVETPPDIYSAPPNENPFYATPRATMTPEEYQALIERRAAAEDYAAQRRAFAEGDANTEAEVPEYRILGRVVPRWRRLGF